MASCPITSQQIVGETMETVTGFLFMGSKITADGHCSHEINRHLLLGRKPTTNIDIVLKNRDISFSTKVHIFSTMVFPVIKHGCENWTIKKSESQRTNAFELWSWKRLLRIPWTAKRLNQSVLKEVNPEYSLKRWMLKLNLQYFVYLKQRANSLEKTMMLRKTEGRRGRGQQRM